MYLGSALFAAAAACEKTAEIEARTVTLHVSSACPAPADGYASYTALGDFQPSPDSPARDGRFVTQVGARLDGLPAAARALVANVSDAQGRWLGVADVPAAGGVDVLLWPEAAACALGAKIPGADDPAVASLDGRRLLVVGGRAIGVPRSWVADLTTGRVAAMPRGPVTVRSRATVTRFGAGALLAGGARADDPNALVDTAEAWDASKGDFDGAPIALSSARADHAAVELGSGDVLLVGGTGPRGAPIGALEIVSLAERRASSGGLPILAPRVSPWAARLASGEVLVAGGADAAGAPVALVEILSRDARAARGVAFVARAKQSATALDGGGALFVLAPDAADPPTFQNVWRLTADGALVPLARLTAPLGDPRLFAASGGGALLWTGAAWLAFDPWSESFAAVPASPGPGARALGASAPDPGLAVWVDVDAGDLRVVGRRFSARGAYATEGAPLAAQDLGPLCPDRSPSLAGVTFDPSSGLALPEGAAVFVADARYGDFSLDADVASGAPPGVLLRDASGTTYELGGADCPGALAAPLHVERVGAAVGAGTGAAFAACKTEAPAGRVAVGLRGHGGVVRNVRLRRTAPLPD